MAPRRPSVFRWRLKLPLAGLEGGLELTKDPVCGMTVDDQSPLRSTHDGQTYVFCSPACKTKFDKEPGRYAPAAGDEAQRGGRR